MIIYVVGNLLVEEDSGPLRLLPALRRAFPGISILEADPNENFIPGSDSIIIDTVIGIKKPQWFTSLDRFEETRSVSPHDYDLAFHLRFLMKLGKVEQLTILGVPPGIAGHEAIALIREKLHLPE